MPAVTRSEELLARWASGERRFVRCILAGENLSGVTLDDIEFVQCDLSGADLSRSSLRRAYMGQCDLREVRLEQAVIHDSHLHFVNFENAKLSRVHAKRASLVGSNFASAVLEDASLIYTSLQNATFAQANLTRTDIQSAKLADTRLSGARCDGLVLNMTVLSDVDLSPLCSAEVEHRGPSIVDYRSVIRSKSSPQLKQFLQGTGMPDIFIDYLLDCARSLDPLGELTSMQSVFLSYGGPDEAIAARINETLRSCGIRTFFFPEHARFGESLDEVMFQGVNEHDRVVVLCSASSLQRAGVLNEIRETLRREAREGGVGYLLPVALDRYVFDEWAPDPPSVKQRIVDRVVADFSKVGEDAALFERQVARLVSALRKSKADS